MATIDFGTGPDTNTGDTVAQALAKLQARLDAGKNTAAPTPASGFRYMRITPTLTRNGASIANNSDSYRFGCAEIRPRRAGAAVAPQSWTAST